MAGLGRIWVPAERPSGWPPGWRVHHVAETGSTNSDLLEAHERGLATDRCVLVADHQTAGRGRLDRRWESPTGTGLLVSMLFESVPEVPSELMQRVGLAAVRAVRGLLEAQSGPRSTVGLKWPNDVLLDDRKLAGVLAQRAASGAVVVGLGLNVGWAPPGGAQLAGVRLDGVRPEEEITTATVLGEILTQFDALPSSIGELYRHELLSLGRPVRVELPGDVVVTGDAVDIDREHRLVVRDGGGELHRFHIGDVVHAGRPAQD